ncbi:hypothetical protein LCGC14_0913320 [marine sediment metagenome]|uniref:Uncharacterized protein n=1 Tax=marine sediment metagenome TaxID=412755 RepID=A0A0F9RZP0_9ZZZZ
MTDIDKQRAEIRAIIDNYTDDGCSFPKKRCSFYRGGYCASNNESYKCLTERLGTAGVVIKVDREFTKPKTYHCSSLPYAQGYFHSEEDHKKAGYVAVEPLVKGK